MQSLFVQVKEYILQLEAHLGETHRQAQRLIKKQSELGSSLGEFGSSLLGLGKFEQPPLADQFLNMGEKSALLARNSQARPHALIRTSIEVARRKITAAMKPGQDVSRVSLKDKQELPPLSCRAYAFACFLSFTFLHQRICWRLQVELVNKQ